MAASHHFQACPKHADKLATYFCEAENEVFCLSCLRQHDTHNFGQVKEICKKYFLPWQKLKENVTKTQKKLEEVVRFVPKEDYGIYKQRLNVFLLGYEKIKGYLAQLQICQLKLLESKLKKYQTKLLDFGKSLLDRFSKESACSSIQIYPSTPTKRGAKLEPYVEKAKASAKVQDLEEESKREEVKKEERKKKRKHSETEEHTLFEGSKLCGVQEEESYLSRGESKKEDEEEEEGEEEDEDEEEEEEEEEEEKGEEQVGEVQALKKTVKKLSEQVEKLRMEMKSHNRKQKKRILELQEKLEVKGDTLTKKRIRKQNFKQLQKTMSQMSQILHNMQKSENSSEIGDNSVIEKVQSVNSYSTNA